MAIRFPNPKKNKDTPPTPMMVEQQVINEQVALTPVRKATDKKQLALLVLLLLVGLGALAYFFLPSLLGNNEPAPTPVAKTQATPAASTPRPASVPVSSQVATNVASTASTAGLNNQTIVITGDHLKNGIPSSASQPPVANTTNEANAQNTPAIENEIAFAGQAVPQTGGDQIAKDSKSSMSYADFVKISETTVFADDTPVPTKTDIAPTQSAK